MLNNLCTGICGPNFVRASAAEFNVGQFPSKDHRWKCDLSVASKDHLRHCFHFHFLALESQADPGFSSVPHPSPPSRPIRGEARFEPRRARTASDGGSTRGLQPWPRHPTHQHLAQVLLAGAEIFSSATSRWFPAAKFWHGHTACCRRGIICSFTYQGLNQYIPKFSNPFLFNHFLTLLKHSENSVSFTRLTCLNIQIQIWILHYIRYIRSFCKSQQQSWNIKSFWNGYPDTMTLIWVLLWTH